MAKSSVTSKLLQLVLPTKKPNAKGLSQTATYNPANSSTTLTAPTYQDHLSDIFSNRTSLDARALIKNLLVQDPDMSASLNAFLTVADTKLVMVARDADGVIDRAGQKILMQLVTGLTTRQDYSKGFKVVQSMNSIAEALRYMVLLRGGILGELVLTQALTPGEMRLVDLASINWYEKSAGLYAPEQNTTDGKKVSLDYPTIFASWFRKDPTTIYSNSPFVSAINTIAARQQVINDLYRIMQLTGYPRMEITVVEEVAMKTAPTDVQNDPVKKQAYLSNLLGVISARVSNIRPDQAFVHFDSVEANMMNENSPGLSMDIDSIISTLNGQNQAGLRTMATIIGRGESGVNTASVEARVFALNAQALNEPCADFLSQYFTAALRYQGSESWVEAYFMPVEMRSDTELETQLVVRQQRLLADLSKGLISDDEYHLAMYGRLAPDDAPLLSGTNFDAPAPTVDTQDITPNSDSLGRSVSAPGGNKGAKDNKTKPKATSASKPK
ncbi:hypothetical protein Lumi_008 [Xylophilus phage Lumi]|nr:hypothetical protein Lumi_008 [Xylophilus phage Lumi]